ncbi:FabD/lysophospholipase-like protein [Microthyrium microscopicum]|uniref:FabD/lysophospholipase-like protein n=1 Tax=Microthyrium microscopicum TaxID=703497 RepID=A0A6A6UD23_9PEZI|nr:FabD/lysophospholipase-like protein [Microthyrium microscopicum]
MSSPVVGKTLFAAAKGSRVVFMFSGLGSHHAGMAKELYQVSTSFRASLDEMETIVTSLRLPSFIKWLIGADSLPPDDIVVKIGTVAMEVALAMELERRGLVPDMVIGHSIGSIAALCVSGVLSLTDTFFFVGRQSQIIERRCEPYDEAMLAIRATVDTVIRVVGHKWDFCDVCCYNSEKSIVVGGPTGKIRRLRAALMANRIETVELPMQYAYHTRQLEPAMEEIRKTAKLLTFNRPRIPIASTVLGKVVTEAEIITYEYTASVERVPVQFSEALKATRSWAKPEEEAVWLELGPGSACCSFVRATLEVDQKYILHTIDDVQDSRTTFFQCAAMLMKMGIELDMELEMSQDIEAPQDRNRASKVDAATGDPFKVFVDTLSRQIQIKVQDLFKAGVPDKTFEELGLSSMQAVVILRVLKEQTGTELPTTCFREYPTLTAMKEKLEKMFPSVVQPMRSTVSPEQPGRLEPKVYSFLLQGTSESQQPAFFLLADGEGSATSYVQLPQFHSHIPVYALPSPFVDNPSDDHTIEEVAPMILEEIIRIRPHGPYLLGGWSLGGTMAYEVSRLLSLAGRKVIGLIIIDSASPSIMFGAEQVNLELVTASNQVRGIDVPLKSRQNIVMSHNMLCKYRGKAWHQEIVPFKTFLILARYTNFEMQSINTTAAKELLACMKKGGSMPQRFKDGGMPGAGWGAAEKSSFGPNGWEKLLGSTVQTIVVEGTHYLMMQQPLVQKTGVVINQAVEEILTGLGVEAKL